MIKKLIASILLSAQIFALMAGFLATDVSAQNDVGPWYNQSPVQFYQKVYNEDSDEIFGERYTTAQVQWIIYALWSNAVNLASGNNQEAVSCAFSAIGDKAVSVTKCGSVVIDAIKNTLSLSETSDSAVSNSNKTLFSLVFASDRPVSAISYFTERVEKIKLVPEVNAQDAGFGFGALKIVQPIWRGVRNATYSMFILIILILAFMIMFRVKISPQVVITVQSAIPRVVLAIILVTFSYAIAGFLIDFMYLVIGLLSIFFEQSQLAVSSKLAFQFMTGTLPLIGGGIFSYLLSFITLFGITLLYSIVASVPILSPAVTSLPLLIILAMLALVLLFFVLVWQAFKIIWMLIKAVAGVYLLTIFAPIQLAFGALNPQIGFASWLRSMIANLMVFPIVGGMFALAFIFIFLAWRTMMDTFFASNDYLGIFTLLENTYGFKIGNPGQPWAPPLIGGNGSFVTMILVGVSLAIVMLISKTADIIKGLIEGKPFGYGTAIGEATGPVVGVGRMGLGAYTSKVEEMGAKAAKSSRKTYIPNWWVRALKTGGIVK